MGTSEEGPLGATFFSKVPNLQPPQLSPEPALRPTRATQLFIFGCSSGIAFFQPLSPMTVSSSLISLPLLSPLPVPVAPLQKVPTPSLGLNPELPNAEHAPFELP